MSDLFGLISLVAWLAGALWLIKGVLYPYLKKESLRWEGYNISEKVAVLFVFIFSAICAFIVWPVFYISYLIDKYKGDKDGACKNH
jgi:hypothetical protein